MLAESGYSRRMDRIAVTPGPGLALVRVPGSKSLTNRALICAALAKGKSTLSGASDSDDSRRLLEALRTLGFEAALDRVVGGGGRIPVKKASLAVGNAGTAFRFLTAFLCVEDGTYTLDGDERMRERPIGPLVDALAAMGASIRYLGRAGHPPLEIAGRQLPGAWTKIKADESSQFASALLLVAPAAAGNVEVALEGPPASKPYVDMTLGVMRAFGAHVDEAGGAFKVRGGGYRATDYIVEGDAAAAGYHWARAALTQSKVRVEGLGASCRQPEYALVDDLAAMGADVAKGADFTEVSGHLPLSGIDVDMNARPDSVQTLAVVALFARGRTRIRNVRNLRIKETDRLAALAKELGKCGARVIEHADGIEIDPPDEVRGAEIETYKDHRMAMSFAVAGAAAPGFTILEPDVVTKSYPGFWDDWTKKGGNRRTEEEGSRRTEEKGQGGRRKPET